MEHADHWLMPVLLKIKDKYKYDDFDSDGILHTDGKMFRMKRPCQPYDPVRLETFTDEQIFCHNLIERANSLYDGDRNYKLSKMQKLEARLQQKVSPEIEPGKKMAAMEKLAELIRGERDQSGGRGDSPVGGQDGGQGGDRRGVRGDSRGGSQGGDRRGGRRGFIYRQGGLIYRRGGRGVSRGDTEQVDAREKISNQAGDARQVIEANNRDRQRL